MSDRVIPARTALVGYLVLLAGVLGTYLNGQHTSKNERTEIRTAGRIVALNGCNARFVDRVEIRRVLEVSAALTKVQYDKGLMDKFQYEQAKNFYKERLNGLPLPDCRTADDYLVDNADLPPLPTPRYPNDGVE
jgi:hypothetical protein